MPITVKVDVYCFGILLLELICCRKSYKQDVANETEMILVEWACDWYRRKELHLLAGDDEEAIEDIERFEKLLMVAIWCIQENPALRPSMKKVMLTLEGLIMNDEFQVVAIIEKLPHMWKDFKNYLKHKCKEMIVEDLIVRLRIEQDNKVAERRSKGNSTINGAYIVEDDQNNSKKRKKV
ncbi:hypothetical protein CQW23_06539 [Capsicum baccatum]|uniref:Protein kinase domain-containing protein n=1 Tax=Capsicum baccatum TaxID=33114 RepID=A0A2G2X3N2_CAPBA|nr:hypothetical protein CQW23_06539 [Capsicum baccatum]